MNLNKTINICAFILISSSVLSLVVLMVYLFSEIKLIKYIAYYPMSLTGLSLITTVVFFSFKELFYEAEN